MYVNIRAQVVMSTVEAENCCGGIWGLMWLSAALPFVCFNEGLWWVSSREPHKPHPEAQCFASGEWSGPVFLAFSSYDKYNIFPELKLCDELASFGFSWTDNLLSSVFLCVLSGCQFDFSFAFWKFTHVEELFLTHDDGFKMVSESKWGFPFFFFSLSLFCWI